MARYDGLEQKLGYVFDNKALLETALTHSSYTAEQGKSYTGNNERLEFIGDAYLDAIVGLKLFAIMPEAHEGVLSKTRAAVVCARSLAAIGKELGLGAFLRLGRGEEISGGREKESLLADAMEAVLGAILLDGGYDRAATVVKELFADTVRLAVKGELYRDYKTLLQERLQERYRADSIVYEIVSEEGPDHDKVFDVQVSVCGRVLGRGKGKSKKEAEQSAAQSVIVKGEW